MKTKILLRKIHYWASLVIMAPLGIVIVAGLFLILKKEFDWVQPSTISGVARDDIPVLSVQDLFQAAQSVDELELDSWSELSRVDFKPGKGVVKFVAPNNWEAQIDTATGDVLQVAYRRSDIIEALHDGSFFADWVKLYIFFPTGVVLLGMWGTGIYLFFLPRWKRGSKKRAKQKRATASV
ncbi:MAG: PepSY-associated TM helix domain-containing protein [Pseudomonadota bacterium]